MADVKDLLARQAEWQKARRFLSWPEKLRQAEAMRETLLQFRSLRVLEARRSRLGSPMSESPRQSSR